MDQLFISTKRFNFLLLVLLGTLLAMAIFFSSGATFILSLVFLIFLFLRRLSSEDKRFVLSLFIIGIGARILATFFLHIFLSYHNFRGADLFADGGDNSVRGWLLAQYWLGDMAHYVVYTSGHNTHGWTYLTGFFYLLFGYSPLGMKFINCLLSVLTGIIIYFIAKEAFSTKVGKLSAIFTVFFPSLFLWSLSNLKETSLIFALSAVLWFFINFQKRKGLKYLVFLILALRFLATLRGGLALGMFIAMAFSYICMSRFSVIKKIGICLIAILVLQNLTLIPRINFKERLNKRMFQALNYSRGYVWTGGSTYKVFDDKYYPGGSLGHSDYISFRDFTKGFFKAWFYFLLAPFPWRTSTELQLLSYPQVILWYLLIPFIVVGMVISVRYKWKEAFVIFAYIIVWGSIIAMTSGNIGTVFRHRDMFTPLFLIFASVGLIKTFGRLQLGGPQLKRTE